MAGDLIRKSYSEAFARIYDAVALDYDGTLIPITDRAAQPSIQIIRTLGKILNFGIPVVVITGRGESLLVLRRLLSRFDLKFLFLAMYNGSRIIQASSGTKLANLQINLERTYLHLKGNARFKNLIAGFSLKPYAIQVFVKSQTKQSMDKTCVLLQHDLPKTLVVRNSGYSLDVFPLKATKNTCLGIVDKFTGEDLRYLRIADQGHELGNDYELLDDIGGFSVGSLSSDPRSCFPVLDEAGQRVLGPTGVAQLLDGYFHVR